MLLVPRIMLLQVMVLVTPTINATEQTDLSNSVGPKAPLKSHHQHMKRMELAEHNQYSSELCTICREQLGANSREWPICKHLYHFNCIDEWRKGEDEENNQCPNCRSTDTTLAAQKEAQFRLRRDDRRGLSRVYVASTSSNQSRPPSLSDLSCRWCGGSMRRARVPPASGQWTFRVKLVCQRCNSPVMVHPSALSDL
ncbi:uncharacterized protein PGTG_20654 [Puccinia graminis f. sp. tritici CRL 75-36-700-3]|uniref:RING-type domain-containing protein n=1 Tax=Puccinia graminis f. sp. tritici (strain CRL 75-36-700-3 / race SCCL) TaxID=418459 RepID=H6QPC1_PUCGT|nr:uncharacterized protein PGTG_20654 [Puccinia graminis f. sp. tritici CRL 75-36-700-3]EHS63556.1 hypothetical protein PGTG_20654 [Puccinia graminis f. sp. tritici CRL 75-36-700-3]